MPIDDYHSLTDHPGAHWFRADLHIHTPASHDFKWDGIDRESFGARLYVEALLAKGLSLVAVTDHSSAAWIDEMKKAARSCKKQGRLVILPGVEINVGGFHLLLIFPEDCDGKHVEHVLSQLDIAPKDWGRKQTCSPKSIADVVRICHDNRGLVVGAHCLNERSGVLSSAPGKNREQALKLIDAIEVKPHHDPEYARRVARQLGRGDIAILLSSDAHHPTELSDQGCYLKMGRPSFQGLRQIIFEPIQRIAYGTPPMITHPRIIGYKVTKGILPQVPVRFSPNLNVVIGGRGGGKSMLLDLVRFAFDLGVRVEENEAIFHARIQHFVGMGGIVRLFLVDAKGAVLCVERRGDYTELRRGGRTLVSLTWPPVVYELIDEDFVALDETPLQRFPLEFFAQGEVLELTKKADDQLALLDEHIDFGGLWEKEDAHIKGLAANASDWLEAEERLEALNIAALEKLDLKTRVEYLREKLASPIFNQRKLWDQERAALDWGEHRLDALGDFVGQNLPGAGRTCPALDPNHPNPASIAAMDKLIQKVETQLEDLRDQALSTTAEASTAYRQLREDWESLDAASLAEFEVALAETQASGLQALMKEQAEKEQALRHIETNVEPQLRETTENIKELRFERQALLDELTACRDSIHEVRQRQLEMVSQRLDGAVRFSIERHGDRMAFSDQLRAMYQGSGIQHQETQMEKVVERLTPRELAAFILNKDPAGLANATSVTPITASKMVQFPTREAVFALEIVPTPDVPTISLRRAGDDTFTPLEHLSYGERCSAVLAIALLDKNRPLILDQPEEELDHQFIIDEIVGGIKKIKEARQLIVATHNPNIPVLGDAELVLHVVKCPGEERCDLAVQGALEDEHVLRAVQALDGGPAAFKRRLEKYTIT